MIDQQITIPQAEYEALQHYKRVYSEVSQILACLADCEPPKDGDEITVQRLKWVVREYPELVAAPEAPAPAVVQVPTGSVNNRSSHERQDHHPHPRA